MIIDVRSKEEYAIEGNSSHRNIPFEELVLLIQNHSLPKDEQYILVCRTGNRSEFAKELMLNNGYINVVNEGLGVRCS